MKPKTARFAPMPIASASAATIVNAGDFKRSRVPWWMSRLRLSTHVQGSMAGIVTLCLYRTAVALSTRSGDSRTPHRQGPSTRLHSSVVGNWVGGRDEENVDDQRRDCCVRFSRTPGARCLRPAGSGSRTILENARHHHLGGLRQRQTGSVRPYTFAETDGLREYRLKGKGISKFAGQRVELVGGTSGNGLSVRTGLWPAPSGGARGVARDPAQESVSRQPGGGGATGGEFQEFRVARVRAIEGACE